MATHRKNMLNEHTLVDGECYFAPLSADAGYTTRDLNALFFNEPAADISCKGGFWVPAAYAGTLAKVVIGWTTPYSGTNLFGIEFSYRAVGVGEDIDAAWTETVNATDAAAATPGYQFEHSITLTHGNFAAKDFVPFALIRDDSADTIADVVIVTGLHFEWDD